MVVSPGDDQAVGLETQAVVRLVRLPDPEGFAVRLLCGTGLRIGVDGREAFGVKASDLAWIEATAGS